MANNKIRIGIENIIYFFAIIMCAIYFFENMADRTMIVIFALLTLIPLILTSTPLFSMAKREKKFSTFVLNLKYSSFMFICGIFFTRLLVKKELLKFPGSVVFFSIMIFGIVIIFSFGYYILDYMYKRDKIIEDYIKVQKRSNIKGFDELLQTIDTKNANVLAVAGNLLSMKTKPGIELLKKFLEKEQSNKLKLIIPKASKEYLKDIKEKIPELLGQIEGFICEPFWFLQGVVIIGRVDEGRKNALTPLGCFYYKTKLSDNEVMSDEGIFIDLEGMDLNTDLTQAVCAYYFLLNTFKYSQNQYEVEKVFRNISDYSNPMIHNPKIEIINWTGI